MLEWLLGVWAQGDSLKTLEKKDYRKQRMAGRIFFSLFVVSILLYKTVLPDEYFFLFSWLMSVIGVPLFFVTEMDLFFIRKGWEVSNGRYDVSSFSKFVNLILSAVFFLSGLFLPIVIKLNI